MYLCILTLVSMVVAAKRTTKVAIKVTPMSCGIPREEIRFAPPSTTGVRGDFFTLAQEL